VELAHDHLADCAQLLRELLLRHAEGDRCPPTRVSARDQELRKARGYGAERGAVEPLDELPDASREPFEQNERRVRTRAQRCRQRLSIDHRTDRRLGGDCRCGVPATREERDLAERAARALDMHHLRASARAPDDAHLSLEHDHQSRG